MLERDLRDLLLRFRTRFIRQRFDLAARPEAADAVACNALQMIVDLVPLLASARAGHDHTPIHVRELHRDDDRLARIQVRNALRPHLGGRIVESQLDIRQHRTLELLEQR